MEPAKPSEMDRLGLVQVYTGNGKGKTTTALGITLRALGHGFSVCVIQFMKGASYLGELESAKRFPNLRIIQFGEDCPWSEQIKSGKLKCGNCRFCFTLHKEDQERAGKAMNCAKEISSSGKFDIVILDEVNGAIYRNIVDLKSVVELINAKSQYTELILTGRNAHPDIVSRADLVSEINEIKHPMSRGIEGRRGIDY